MKIPLLLCFTFLIYSAQAESNSDTDYARAVIESCPGCSLNRLPEVKKFIYEDVPKYEKVEFKKIQGAPPELVLLNDADVEMDRLKLNELNRHECNDLLTSKGFKLKENAKLEL